MPLEKANNISGTKLIEKKPYFRVTPSGKANAF